MLTMDPNGHFRDQLNIILTTIRSAEARTDAGAEWVRKGMTQAYSANHPTPTSSIPTHTVSNDKQLHALGRRIAALEKQLSRLSKQSQQQQQQQQQAFTKRSDF